MKIKERINTKIGKWRRGGSHTTVQPLTHRPCRAVPCVSSLRPSRSVPVVDHSQSSEAKTNSAAGECSGIDKCHATLRYRGVKPDRTRNHPQSCFNLMHTIKPVACQSHVFSCIMHRAFASARRSNVSCMYSRH